MAMTESTSYSPTKTNENGMSDRLPSDHPTVETSRARVTAHGGRHRLEVDTSVLPTDEVVRLVLDETARYIRPTASPTGDTLWITGAYASPGQARDPGSATEYLAPWLDTHDRAVGSTVLLDEIEPEFAYGLREPGRRTVYSAVEKPSDSLATIAKRLDK